MPSADDFKINLNQNLWGLVVSLGALGASEHWSLRTLYWFALVVSVVMALSVIVTTFVYTLRYCQKKLGG
jgi:glucan phosphoethanolaminetransferase (alkaline phosphatase superfamily)